MTKLPLASIPATMVPRRLGVCVDLWPQWVTAGTGQWKYITRSITLDTLVCVSMTIQNVHASFRDSFERCMGIERRAKMWTRTSCSSLYPITLSCFTINLCNINQRFYYSDPVIYQFRNGGRLDVPLPRAIN